MSTVTAADSSAAPLCRACPFCGGKQVTTNSAKVSDGTYWRCQKCGQIWNPSRLRPLPRWQK